jgi:hypothetical protein
VTSGAAGLPGEAPPERRSPSDRGALGRRGVAVIAGVRAVVSAGVLAAGFRAVSDDDYSRVVIAQGFAAAPKLDPSGTSWLPAPFWAQGGAMVVLGRSLLVAQGVAVVCGVAASFLVAAAARRITGERRVAVVAGCYAGLVGWAAWLGVATVPELLTAALVMLAAGALVGGWDGGRESGESRVGALRRCFGMRMAGAIALLVATLSRYEPWPVAIAFAVWNLVDAARGGAVRARAIAAALPASIVAIAGPIAWIAWNRAAHGDALHFVARVTAYRRALGEGANESVLARLVAYPAALAAEMPEVAIPAALVLLAALVPRVRGAMAPRWKRHAAPLVLALVQIVALAAALVKDGAPTHHPERAVLFPALALVVMVSDAAVALAPDLLRSRAGMRIAAVAAGLLLLGRAVATPIARRDAFAQRDSEVAMGALVSSKAPRDARIYLEATDYGYFAIFASSGRPESFVLDHDLDPRHPTERPIFATSQAFAAWLRERGFTYVVSPRQDGAPPASRFEGTASWPTKRHVLSAVPQ